MNENEERIRIIQKRIARLIENSITLELTSGPIIQTGTISETPPTTNTLVSYFSVDIISNYGHPIYGKVYLSTNGINTDGNCSDSSSPILSEPRTVTCGDKPIVFNGCNGCTGYVFSNSFLGASVTYSVRAIFVPESDHKRSCPLKRQTIKSNLIQIFVNAPS